MPDSPRRELMIGCRLIADLDGADICIECGVRINRDEIGLIICGNCHTIYANALGVTTQELRAAAA